jgi:hypothetical protein
MSSRKRPTDPIPEAYTGVKSEDVTVDTEIKQVPPKTVLNHNLKKLKSYKKIRSGYKVKNQKQIFVNDLKVILSEFDTSEYKLNLELLTEIIQIAEDFMVYGSKKERDSSKLEAIQELMITYFKDDAEFLEKSVYFCYKNVSKSNIFRRTRRKLVNFFFKSD